MTISQDELKNVLSYCPFRGEFTWINPSNNRMTGKRAGSVSSTGRRHIKIGNKFYKEHRLAWLYVYGVMPGMDIDHIDRNPLNNRIQNLRLATKTQNCYNREKPSRGHNSVKGVQFEPRSGNWVSYGSYQKKRIHIGTFESIELAELVSSEFREKYHGDFKCQA